jgi:hypothetical protein
MQKSGTRNPNDRAVAAAGDNRLTHLNDIDDEYQVARGEPDFRGWDVYTRDGHRWGTVADLLVNTDLMKACYVDVDIDQPSTATQPDRHTLVPVGAVQIDEDLKHVVVNVETAQIAALPRYGTGHRPTRDHESELIPRYGYRDDQSLVVESAADNFYGSRHFDDSGFRGVRRGETERYLAPRDTPSRKSGG